MCQIGVELKKQLWSWWCRKIRAQMLQVKKPGTTQIRMMEEILRHLGCVKPFGYLITISTGAGFLPSTVWQVFCIYKHFRWWLPQARMDFHEASTGFNRSVWMWGQCSPLGSNQRFSVVGIWYRCILSISSPKFVSSTWPAPGHFSYWIPTFPDQATANHDNPAGWQLKCTVAKGV